MQENGVLAFAKHVLFPVLDGKGLLGPITRIYMHVYRLSLHSLHTHLPLSVSLSLSLSPLSPSPFPLLSHPPEFVIQRAEKHGGDMQYATYAELEQSYAKEEIYPLDLKNAVSRELSKVCVIQCVCAVQVYTCFSSTSH